MGQLTLTLDRLARLAAFDLGVLDEARRDRAATPAALAVAAGSLLLFSLGGWLWWLRAGAGDPGGSLVRGLVLGTLIAAVLWLVWLLVAVVVLQRAARVAAPVDALLRAAGFAALPLAIGPLMALPGVSFGVGLLALGGWLVMTQSAIEGCAPRARGIAALANLAGFAVWAGAMSLLALGGEPLAPGPFIAEAMRAAGGG